MHKRVTTLRSFNAPENTLEVIHLWAPPAHPERTHPPSHDYSFALVASESVVQSLSCSLSCSKNLTMFEKFIGTTL